MMFPEFPLFEQILDQTTNEPLSMDEKQAVVSSIKSMTEREHEIIFALIQAYQLYHNSSTNGIIPFEGKHLKTKGIKFDLNLLPHRLQQILGIFSELHRKTCSHTDSE